MTSLAATAPMTEIEHFHARLVHELTTRRFSLHDEKVLQSEIADTLSKCHLNFEREVPVIGGRIDFLAGPPEPALGDDRLHRGWETERCIGIEVKIKGSRRALYRQCERYSEDPRIGRLVVVAGLSVALPARIGGKPTTVVQIGRAWL